MKSAASHAQATKAGSAHRSGTGQSAWSPGYGLTFADSVSPRSIGAPLAPPVESRMAARFGRTFSGVRVHADAEAGQLADGLGARAYAVGSSIVFGRGQYNPGSPDGQRLIAHELTHIAQQQGRPATPQAATSCRVCQAIRLSVRLSALPTWSCGAERQASTFHRRRALE